MVSDIIYRRSENGVPHILVSIEGRVFSVCYFGRDQIVKIWDYPTQEQIGVWPLGAKDEVDVLTVIKRHLGHDV